MKIIAVVGGDGAGKTSAAQLVSSTFRPELCVRQIDKWDVLDKIQHPEYRFLLSDLALFRRCVSDMPEITRTLFLFWMLHGTFTPSATRGADLIVLDGYWPKHAASEIIYSGRHDLVEMLISIMPAPTLTLMLDVDPAVAYERRVADKATFLVPYECGLDLNCSKHAFMTHQSKIREILLGWCSTFGWKRLDANVDRAIVENSVLGAVRSAMTCKRGESS